MDTLILMYGIAVGCFIATVANRAMRYIRERRVKEKKEINRKKMFKTWENKTDIVYGGCYESKIRNEKSNQKYNQVYRNH